MTQEPKAHYYFSSYVNLLREFELKRHEKRIEKALKKKLGLLYTLQAPIRSIQKLLQKNNNASFVSVSEMNTFMIAHITLPETTVASKKKRTQMEQKMLGLHIRYTKREIEYIRRKALHSPELKEFHSILRSSLSSLDTKTRQSLTKQMREDLELSLRNTVTMMEELIKNVWLSIWDFPGASRDRIVLNDIVIERSSLSSDQHDDLSIIIDELILALFSKYYIASIEKLIQELIGPLKSLESQTPDDLFLFIPSGYEREVLTLLRSLFGKLSSTSEYILQAKRQVKRLLQIEKEIKSELEILGLDGSDNPLSSIIIPHERLESLLISINDLETLSNKLRQKYVVISQIRKDQVIAKGDPEQLHNLAKAIASYLPAIESLRIWVEQFADIAFMTTMSGNIYEEIEKSGAIDEYLLYGLGLFKTYRLYSGIVHALRGVSLGIKKGEFLGIMGASGSGKTTLLNLLSGLDRPDQGKIFLNGKELSHLSDSKLSQYRKNHMGFIFQSYNLIPHLTVLENTALPAQMAGESFRKARTKSLALLGQIGMQAFVHHFPTMISGGQMQRATIARSLVNSPEILFCDEPTGDLDHVTGEQVMDVLRHFNEEAGTTVVLVTHDESLKKYCDRVVYMKDGQIISEEIIRK